MILAWLWFAAAQLIQLTASLLGLVVLVVPCMLQAWSADSISIKDGRKIDRWTWPINAVYGNPEDGVSGQYALVGGQPFLPSAGLAWRAYRWSALRNTADGLKYVFAWSEGPLFTRSYGTHEIKIGWQAENGYKVPVFSLW